MPKDTFTVHDHCIDASIYQMEKSLQEGGIPIGSVLTKDATILSVGHNQRVQKSNPILHGEMSCLCNAGRIASYRGMSLYSTLSPCMMCSGTIVQFKIPHVVILDVTNFPGNIDFLRSNGVIVDVRENGKAMGIMAKFIKDFPKLWNEDIAE